jgi:cell wall-associated NlpC family hydrolase
MRVIVASSAIHYAPNAMSGRETEALFGEGVIVHQTADDWSDITLETDGYRGWIRSSDLGSALPPTHHVIVPRTLMTAGVDIKSPHQHHLPLGALITTGGRDENGVMAAHGADSVLGYIPASHVLPLGQYVDDYVAVAEGLMNTPYLWGGRDSLGIDCSALVQLSLAAAGVKAGRNSGDQEKIIGETLADTSLLRRGDLVFWRGHVGIMADAETLLHANAYHHMVFAESLKEALPRLHEAVGPVTRLVRPEI